eukprot:gnl/MRDRNA2_/MRDRNA2_112445_c0_seq1.p1 gnl/MRDRNA2_/MRDRNA2_112445_c0~~gnl/MRDRNA2_/MRDRNA2_112445_c0_seq1.p1  ORF type:complete len:596 (-),score=128.89 gnl/MRDRNA2_/MRDRNA2_112445_c0_seq1:44-1831(-)
MEPVLIEGAPVATENRCPVEGVGLARGRGMHLLNFRKIAHSNTVKKASSDSHRGVDLMTAAENLGATISIEPKTVEVDASPIKTGNNVDSRVVRGPVIKDGKTLFPYGNYLNYYSSDGHRGTQDILEDARLTAISKKLGKDVFRGKGIMDIGCNSGAVSLSVLQHFGAQTVLGVDIDATLIEAAEENLKQQCEAGGEAPDASSAFSRVTFKTQNIVTSQPPEKDEFDVVLCLSVTKWIHFAHGDKGICKLFRRCARALRPGGILVLEPQDWKSYKKKRHLTQEIRQSVAGIELRPDKFDEFLVSMGFESLGTVEPEHTISQGFNRTIFLYRKPIDGLVLKQDMSSIDIGSAVPPKLELDARIHAFVQKLGKKALKGKDVLDVGCGNGSLSLSLIQSCRVKKVVGVDINEGCIQMAEAANHEEIQCSNAAFRAEDFVSSKFQIHEKSAFDVVFCLLVTKGIHFAHGDEGVRKLFKRCKKSLRPGGILVLEAQEWQSYTKSRQSALEFRPEHFEEFLLSLSFENLGAAEPCDEVFQGLKRPLYFFRKPMTATEEGAPVQQLQEAPSTEKKRKRDEMAMGKKKKKMKVEERKKSKGGA